MKVLVAMSGGVDSSVAALLLREQGHDIVGVTMRLWGGESDTGCCSVSDVDDARRVAQQLDVDHLVFNFAEDFDAHVVDPYVRAHETGVTPNPCVECNRHLKFDRLLERADALGFDAVATGHHARITTDERGALRVTRGADMQKDQSYVVHMLHERALDRTLFPVGGLTKADVRSLASQHGLRTASKPDSQDVCFIQSTTGREGFLERRMTFNPAEVVDTDGRPAGHVAAVELVTVGQRRGLNLGGGDKRYVVDVDVVTRRVVVGGEEDLLTNITLVNQLSWPHTTDKPVAARQVLVQGSAHGARHEATIASAGDDVVSIEWKRPQRRIAPGQTVVFYDLADTHVVGGGIVTS
ncbi:MAG: tRNA 2-thiouridine(34) synthase MnmA [Actinobacteria bacterium]|nr:tRNA 2-thiouridine(34) synthase MnmA [Actinomycetota bacterium]